MAYVDNLWDVEGEITSEQFAAMKENDITEKCDGSVSTATAYLNTGTIKVQGFHAVVRSERQGTQYLLTRGGYLQNLMMQHFSLGYRPLGGMGQVIFAAHYLLPDSRPLSSSSAIMHTLAAPVTFLHKCDDDVALAFQVGAPLRVTWFLPPVVAESDTEGCKKGEVVTGTGVVTSAVLGQEIHRGHTLFLTIPAGAWRGYSLQEGHTSMCVCNEVSTPAVSANSITVATPEHFAADGPLADVKDALYPLMRPMGYQIPTASPPLPSAAVGAEAQAVAAEAAGEKKGEKGDSGSAAADPSAAPKKEKE